FAVRRESVRACGLILVPHAPATVSKCVHAGIDDSIRGKVKRALERPVPEVPARIVKYVSVEIPGRGDASHVADVHVVDAPVKEDFRRPEGIAAPLELQALDRAA